jgi:ATP-dependent helicase/nuclease subunit A
VADLTPDGTSSPAAEQGLLPDHADRRRIVSDLDSNLLVEAGAGSGKTRALVERMVALVRDRGARVEQIAAVTFTRKAASELRERFQTYLEEALADPGLGATERAHIDRTLRNVDRAFIGTIHSFCARLLRERPLEAGLDPGFRETLEDEEARLSSKFWGLYLERVAAGDGSELTLLDRVGIRPPLLHDLYLALQANADVRFEPDRVSPPDPEEVSGVRDELDRLLRRADDLIPDPCPHEKGPDRVQERLSKAIFLSRILDWSDERDFFEILSDLAGKGYDCTYVRWGDGEVKARVKALEEDCRALLGSGGPAERLLHAWWAHRYPAALRFAQSAADAYAAHRRMVGYLNFNDLLALSAALLRTHPRAREDLGERYRYLLVDEFQDTDPLQAEVVFLLASSVDQGTAWDEVEPRPGQLFVVGDPKQSIYRFRRADMAVYDKVRRRFQAFGDVLTLTANFRSCAALGDLVNAVFGGEDGFPPEPDPYQARFAPLLPQPSAEPRVAEGVFHYRISSDVKTKDAIAEDDAARLAAWIAGRTREGEGDRSPGDFLVLTRERRRIEAYVRAFEAWGLPIQVSGAQVTAEEEVEELMVLLRALIDPGDPVATVAVLSGLFFGLDAEALLVHRERGGRFDLRHPTLTEGEGHPDVVEALGRMKAWWHRGQEEPCDIVVGEMVETLGLVPWAAAGDLGQLRAGALLHGLDAVRASTLEGDASLAGALDALEGVLEAREAEASLEPGRRDAVRIMNLHKAKGLEADVVVLAAPWEPWDPDPTLHVRRGEGGETRGWLVVQETKGYGKAMVARPLDWVEKLDEERRHGRAEEVRLRYVAATRAREELIVSRCPARDGRSTWAVLHPWLDEHAVELDLPLRGPPVRETLSVPGEVLRSREREVKEERESRAAATYEFTSVTRRAKAAPDEASGGSDPRVPQMDLFARPPASHAEPERPSDGAGAEPWNAVEAGDAGEAGLHRGVDWGSAVHAALEAAARGADDRTVRSVARARLLEYQRPLGEDGEPVELPRLMETVRAVRGSEVWRRAEAAPRRLAEVGFSQRLDEEALPTWLDGQVDLAFREDGGWVLVDWKTDLDPKRRVAQYRRQLRDYGRAWSALTGEPVEELLILFTRTGRIEKV